MNAPRLDQAELSLFGPGIGESVVLHVGWGDWIIVDSCLSVNSGRPVAYEYLSSLGVGSHQVKLLVATHWHDDHIAGFGTLLELYPEAKVGLAASVGTKDFQSLLAADEAFEVFGVPAMGEMRKVYHALARRPRQGPDYWITHSTILFARSEVGRSVAIHALSPSASVTTRAFRALASEFYEDDRIRRVTPASPNLASVALWIRFPAVAFLLGADLEYRADETVGWKDALSVIPSGEPNRATVYKVAHHGSANADGDELWGQGIGKPFIAALTPYYGGQTPRPSAADVQRLCARRAGRDRRRSEVWATAPPIAPRPSRIRMQADRALDDITAYRRPVRVRQDGHVIARVNLDSGSIDGVEGRAGARRLC
jgi:hypothetical protein